MRRSLRRAVPLIALAVLAGCARPSAPRVEPAGGESFRLAYGFPDGATYGLRTTVEMEASARSEEPETSKVLEASGPMRQMLTLDLMQTVAALPDGERLHLVTTVADIALETSVEGEPRAMPEGLLAALRRMRLETTMDRRGAVSEVSISRPLPVGWDEETITRLGGSSPTLPEEPIAVGSAFTNETEWVLPGSEILGDHAATVAVSAVYTLRDVRPDRLVFDVRTTSRPAAPGGGALALEGKGSGRAVWDRAGGYFSEVTLGESLRIDVSGDPGLAVTLALKLAATRAPATPTS